jgi:alpha-ketoglutaric semialdehyde dehydrogenase
MRLHGTSFIAGQPAAETGDTFTGTNPATGERLPTAFHKASAGDVDAAMTAAQQAFSISRALPPERIAALLDRMADEILALGDDLIARARAETGLTEPRLAGERARTVHQLKLFAALVREGSWVDAVIDTADPNRQPMPKPDVRRMLRPLGPVVVFGAGNFPFAFGACGGDTASALAAGNPVVVKAHTGHPGTNELFAHAAAAAVRAGDLPPGMFSLLQGPGATVGQALVKHPAACAVGFTGSKRAGRLLFDLAAARPVPIPVYAEMGSLNPLVILPGALADRSKNIAAGLAQSLTLGVGQFCTKPGLIFLLDGAAADTFLGQLVRHLAAVAAAPMLDLGMRSALCDATAGFARVAGVKAVLANAPSGYASMAPQLFEVNGATWRCEPALHEEAFGPAALVIRCRDFEELTQSVRAAGGNLTGTIHAGTNDQPETVRVLAGLLEQQVGRVIFDGYPTGVEVCHAMVHGGPYPATSAPLTTSVGTLAIRRFARPVCFQNVPDAFLPPELRNRNERGLWRLVNGQLTKDDV